MSNECTTARCQVIPLPQHQVSIQLDGDERLRWHFGPVYPRPFFYPLIGPSGSSLVRMGHPGAPDHSHHRGIWFAHHDVTGIDFWSDVTPAKIRQQQWLCFEDGDEEARLAVTLGWFDGHDPQALLQQQVIVAVRPAAAERETLVEIQSTFRPTSQRLEFRQSNFGFLGVRVAKNLSAYFGGGTITDSEARVGEPAIFGQQASWMDYSGCNGPRPTAMREGITYFDHPDNPGYPTHWHVREDGWMIAAACMQQPLVTAQQAPLTLRYLLHAHAGPVDVDRVSELAADFHRRGAMEVVKSNRKHTAYEIHRVA